MHHNTSLLTISRARLTGHLKRQLLRKPGFIAPKPRLMLPEKVYGKVGSLEVRMARSRTDLLQAQRLRYSVFYEEMSAKLAPSPPCAASIRMSTTASAIICWSSIPLLMPRDVRWISGRRPRVVGTYRVLRQEKVPRELGFLHSKRIRYCAAGGCARFKMQIHGAWPQLRI